MQKRIALLFVLIMMIGSGSHAALACTIFNAVGNGMILAGNNEDHDDPNAEVRFETASEGKFGKITFAFGPFTQGGMNDHGLFFDFYAGSEIRMSPLIKGQTLPSGEKPDKEPTLDGMYAIYTQYDVASKKMLETCATLDEAINFYQKNYEGTLGYGYLMVADKTGASATITWDWEKSELRVTRKSGSFQVIGVGSQYIYPRLNGGNYEVSIDYFRELLKNTSRDDTAYSNIYDLQQGVIYVYCKHNFDKMVRFDLGQELAKGEHSFFLKDIF